MMRCSKLCACFVRAALFACFLVIYAAGSTLANPPTQSGVEVFESNDALPEPVRKMHTAILEAARSGNVETLQPVMEMNELKPTISFGEVDDPVRYWKRSSGDGEGRQILAILSEILELPYAHVNKGKDDEMYVWPYLAELSLDKLAPPQLVDLYRLVTPEEAEAMKDFGGYIHYRLGIGRDGTWHYFVAGD